MTQRQAARSRTTQGGQGVPLFLVLVLLLGGALGVFHLAALLVSSLAGGTPPPFADTLSAVLSSWKNPAKGFTPAAHMSGWVYPVFALLIAVMTAMFVLVAKVFTPRGQRGASTAQALRHRATFDDVRDVLSREAALRQARSGLEQTMIRASMDKAEQRRIRDFIKTLPEGYLVTYLGKKNKKELFAQSEDSTLVVAPPRAGKTMYIAAGRVIDAPGAVLATSTRADLLQITAGPRSEKGRVWAFDVDGISGWPHQVRWNPVLGCENIEVAKRRGDAWAGAQPMGHDAKNEGFFNSKAGHVLSRLLFAAAIGGKTMADVVEWSNNLASDKPRQILQDHRDAPGAEMALSYLESLSSSRAGETVDSVQLTLSNLLEPLALPRVMEMLSCPPEEAFDIPAFLESTDTVVLMADEEAGNGTSPIVSMFATEVIVEARKLSQTKPGARYWPPFRMVLDEAANLAAFPQMAKYMADSGGRGIEVSVFAQTFSQLRSRWGSEDAETIQSAATVKYYLPGLGTGPEVKDLSELIGPYEKRNTTRTRQSRGGVSSSESFQERPIMSPKEINEIPTGTAILRYRNRTPVHIELLPWWERDDAQAIDRALMGTARARGIDPTAVPEVSASLKESE